jgi:phenylalanyl-tRNA synthetase alpha chain
VREEIIDIFHRLGFSVAEGPEIEDDWHVFSSLNFAADHPARDMQDTFFIQRNPADVLLRTHTSSVQSRVMETTQPPIRIICPGRVYRNEAISARAHCFFHQVEALYVDKNVSFSVQATSPSPSLQQKWISAVTFVVVKAAHSASIPAGLKFSVAAWLTRMC